MLVFLEQHPILVFEFQKIFHVPGVLGSPVHFHLYSLVSASQLGRAFPGFCPRRPAAGQVVLVAKACCILDIECFSLYPVVHYYLNSFYMCVQPLCAILGNDTEYLEICHLFRTCLGAGVGGKQTANGM